jgi:hypothetical protein
MTRTVFAALALAALSLLMLGCQPPAAPFQGKVVTEEELPRVVESAVRAQQETDRLEAEAISREASKRQAAFELAVSRMDATHALDLAGLRAEYEASSAATRDALASIERRSSAAIASIRDEAQTAAASIAMQKEQRLGVFKFAEQVIPMTPAAPWSGLITTALAGVLGVERIRKGVSAAKAEKQAIVDRDANYEEGYKRGKEEAEAARRLADDAWDLAEARARGLPPLQLTPPPTLSAA